MDDIRARHYETFDAARQAFEELCAMVSGLELEREEQREAARARFLVQREKRALLMEKNRALREKYIMLLEKYNELAEEVIDKSDSSSSSSSSDDDCCIM